MGLLVEGVSSGTARMQREEETASRPRVLREAVMDYGEQMKRRIAERRAWRDGGKAAPSCDRCGAQLWCVSEVKADEHGGPDLCHRCCGWEDECCDECVELGVPDVA